MFPSTFYEETGEQRIIIIFYFKAKEIAAGGVRSYGQIKSVSSMTFNDGRDTPHGGRIRFC
jgi:hypothetical protein